MSKGTKQISIDDSTNSESETDHMDALATSLYKLGNYGIDIPFELEGINISMEPDTGAGVSIISEETYKKYFREIPLNPCTTKLHTYTKEAINVLGKIKVNVAYQGQHARLPLVVVKGTGPSLLGRDWLSVIKLDWARVINLQDSIPQSAGQDRLKEVTDNNAQLFQPGLGTIKGITARFEVKEGATPQFCKARPVPYSLLDSVNEEYDRLERQGIVEKVEFSNWATPMVHIRKPDGTTRSCGDYALTVNPQLNVNQYPIPLPEEVFQKLRGGKLFTKLDLRNAYQQLRIDEDSLPYVTINTHRGLYRYKRLPFGIASSPALFQKTMDAIL